MLLFETCIYFYSIFFFFKQKTAYEMCGRDWSSDVCSSDLGSPRRSAQSTQDAEGLEDVEVRGVELAVPGRQADRKSVV